MEADRRVHTPVGSFMALQAFAVAAFRRFLAEEDGQDLMEYVFLCAFIAITGILVWQAIVTLLGDRYVEYNTQVQDIWASPDP